MTRTQLSVRIGIITISLLALGSIGTVQAQTDLIISVHEDQSITLKTLNGTELKGYSNVNALAGPNGLVDILEQLELWNQ